MQFGLTSEQQLLVDSVRQFVDAELMPYEEEVERTDHGPPRADPTDPRARPQGRLLRRQHAGGARRRRPRPCRPRADGARARPHLLRPAICGGPALQHPARLQGPAGRALSAAGDPRRARRVPGDDRAERRLRPALHEDQGRARRRPLRHQRHQAFHQLRRRRRLHRAVRRHRQRGDGARLEEEDHLVPGRQGHARPRGAHGAEVGLAPRLPPLRADLHELPRQVPARCWARSTRASTSPTSGWAPPASPSPPNASDAPSARSSWRPDGPPPASSSARPSASSRAPASSSRTWRPRSMPPNSWC